MQLSRQMLRRWTMQTEIRDWRALSEAASREQDPEKLMQLVEELNHALLRRELDIKARRQMN